MWLGCKVGNVVICVLLIEWLKNIMVSYFNLICEGWLKFNDLIVIRNNVNN